MPFGRVYFRLTLTLVFTFVLSTRVCAQTVRPDHEQRMKQGTELFLKTVRQTLLDRCLKCHGGEKTRGDFDLATRKSLLDSGYVDLQDPQNSYLLTLIRHTEEPHMPPTGDRLSDSQIADIARWIGFGAPYDRPLREKTGSEPSQLQVTRSDREFWSFRELADPVPPADDGEWAETDVDRFVLARLKTAGLQPNPPAADRARIRRAWLDVVGLPPTPEQVEASLAMSHEHLVDLLLDSPHYGERWARHWLDAARFAESHGFEQDYDRSFAYHYRDFVIKALNSDMPWDQFVQWQIAGDEIAPKEPLALMATGFLGAGVFPTQLTEKEFESARYDELDDMAATIGTAMLGLTIGCARCHDHKFDPIPAADYYRFISTFTTTIRSEIDVDLDPQEYQTKIAQWQASHKTTTADREAYRSRADVIQRFDQWLQQSAESAVADRPWTILDASEAVSSQAATTLKVQPDGAILANGKPPTKETYTVRAAPEPGLIRFLRIEALTHKSMKRRGPGRAANGNFALSDLQLLTVASDESTRRQSVRFAAARATHQQNDTQLSAASAIDKDRTGTGWAVDFGGIGQDQAAVFELKTPLSIGTGTQLEIRLTFANNAQHSLGRFRLSVSSAMDPPVAVGGGQSSAVSRAVQAVKNGVVTPEHRNTLFPIFAAGEDEWKNLNRAVEASLAKKPQPKRVKVQVSSEGFRPTKHHADGRGFPHFYPQTHFLERGDPQQKKGVAEPGFLQVLMRGNRTSSHWQQAPPAHWTRTSYRRTGMANWMTDTEFGAGHLLARVIVNRVWHHHFGRGIVATPNDFGLQGTPPTHPELLDFLARRLIAGGWQLKSLHREILCSATWRQSTQRSAENAAIDPDNQWLWRFPSRRLEAEIVRDAMLAASGVLDTKMFGPGTLDPNQRRRSIYFTIKRSRLVPMMQIFDQPEPLSSQGSRPSTTIAPQALLFMNNPQVVAWATAFAKSVDGQDTDTAIRSIYRRALAREPNPQEQQQSRRFVDEQAKSYEQALNRDAAAGKQLALTDLCQIIFGLNEFIYLP